MILTKYNNGFKMKFYPSFLFKALSQEAIKLRELKKQNGTKNNSSIQI